MGFTAQFFVFMFGFVLVTKTLQASADDEIPIREDRETRCIGQCPVIHGRCLQEGREKSACKRIARRCAWLCVVDGMTAKREKISKKPCKQRCFGNYQQCLTVAFNIKEQRMCVSATSFCYKKCSR